MWQILFFALPPQIKAPITTNKTSNKMKYYNQPTNKIPKYIKSFKRYKTYK